MQAFTGHCAHSFDCGRWESGCGECPDLETYPPLQRDSTGQLWQDKLRLYEQADFWIVTPSQWLRSKVERSLLKNHRVEHIPNGVDTERFQPTEKAALRRKHGLANHPLLIGCVANFGLTNIYKGGTYAAEIMRAFHQEFPNARFLNRRSPRNRR